MNDALRLIAAWMIATLVFGAGVGMACWHIAAARTERNLTGRK